MKAQPYIAALYAWRPDPEQSDIVDLGGGRSRSRLTTRPGEDDVWLSQDVAIFPLVVMARTAAEAEQIARESALAGWPPADGWVGHQVIVERRPLYVAVREAYGDLLGLPPLDSGEGEEEVEELLM
jgi:hypothetical protein